MGASRAEPGVVVGEIGRIARFIERPDLPATLGLTREQLEDPDVRVPIGLWYDFMEAATTASGDAFLGLHFGLHFYRHYRENAGAMGLLVISSDTVRIAIERMARYQRYWNEAERYELAENERELVVRYAPWGPARPAHVQLAEKTVAQIVRFVRTVVPGAAPLAIRFPHERRPGSEELAQHLGVEPRFGQAVTEIVLGAPVLEARLPTADAALFRVLDRTLADRIRAVTAASAYADRTRKTIADYLHREQLTIDLVAKVLNTSERTLQRRLTDEKTSFRDLVDEVRRSRALALLDSGASVGELVPLLGFVEETAFYRAFRRWTGATPETWRSPDRASRT